MEYVDAKPTILSLEFNYKRKNDLKLYSFHYALQLFQSISYALKKYIHIIAESSVKLKDNAHTKVAIPHNETLGVCAIAFIDKVNQ